MSVNSYTCKIPVVDSNSVCIINSEWSSTDIKLLLLHDNQAWSGEFQLIENEDITELLDQLSLSKETYVEESKKALTTHGGVDNFAYTLENEKFTWKKHVRKTMSVKFGSVNLLKVPLFEAFEKVVDNTLQSNLTFFTKLQSGEKEREILEKENNTLKCKLDELVEKKNEMETRLYSQFLYLLNEKKRKIKELKRKIPTEGNADEMQSESDHFNSDTEIDSEEEVKPCPSKVTCEGSSLDTEDEPVILPKRSRQKRQNENVAGPSRENSKAKNSKTRQPKKETVNGKKRDIKSVKDSCVMGRTKEEKEKDLSESSEDVFAFKKRSRRTISAIQPSTSKIKYESDDETYLDNNEELNCDIDNTPSQIDQAGSTNRNEDQEPEEKNKIKNKSIKQETEDENKETNMANHKSRNESGNSQATKNTIYKGLSSSTLEILNQLM